jgi:hypothetical protein
MIVDIVDYAPVEGNRDSAFDNEFTLSAVAGCMLTVGCGIRFLKDGICLPPECR